MQYLSGSSARESIPSFTDATAAGAHLGSSGGAAAALLDIVVFTGGDSTDLMPLCAFEQKCMLRVCNRPMIWYCLAPWVEAGFHTFFVCVNEDYATLRTYLSREFGGVDFNFVVVPSVIGEHASTTCDAVKEYLQVKENMRAAVTDSSAFARDGAAASADRDGGSHAHAAAGAASPTTAGRSQPLRVERAAMAGMRRDALLLSCDTLLAGVDVERFISRFYTSMASASAMLFRPYAPPVAAAGPAAGGGGGKGAGRKKAAGGGDSAGAEQKQFSYAYTCVAYEEEDVLDAMTAGGHSRSSGRDGSGMGGAGGDREDGGGGDDGDDHTGGSGDTAATAQHRRLHYMYPLDEKPELRITMAFAARRPDLTFAADVVDANAYVVRHWVLDLIAESAGLADVSVGQYIMPLLARSQHSIVNVAENAFLTPDKKILHAIPGHWLFKKHGELSVKALNAAKGPMLPDRADNLRVFCSIYTERPGVPLKIYRINTRDNYQAINQELVLAKCDLLHLLDAPAGAAGAAPAAATAGQMPSGGGSRGRAPPLIRASGGDAGGEGASGTGRSLSSSALALCLPDKPFTLRERLGSQQVCIVGSFVDSVPSPNTYITRSVIGPNVTIAAGTRITDSVILANVDIGAKVVIANSIIGTSAVVNAGRRIISSIVGPQCVVEQDQQDQILEWQ